jgi:signal transduction histidine kinase
MKCDRNLIEHVLLNLVNNASDAISAKTDYQGGSIEIEGTIGENDRPIIHIRDNGAGIPEDILQNIFIPFFTTKEQGSGIGLSLARQIMKLHGGTITVSSKLGTGTVFSLIF